jgi:hypothetical protein
MNTNKKKEKKLDFYFMRLEIPQFSCTFARNKAENYFIVTGNSVTLCADMNNPK